MDSRAASRSRLLIVLGGCNNPLDKKAGFLLLEALVGRKPPGGWGVMQ